MNNLDTVNKAIDCSKCGNVNMFEMYSNSRTRGHQLKIKIQEVLETSVNRFKSSLSKTKVSSEKKLFCDYD